MRRAGARRDPGRWRGLLVGAAPLLGACYVYQPVLTPEPQPGARFAFDLNDQGREALVASVGPAAARVEGALVSDVGGEYVIRVSDVLGLQGTRTRWRGEAVSFRQEYVKRVRERRLSRGRTVFTVAAVLGAVVALVASTDLIGFGGGGDNRPGSGVGEGQ